MRRVAFDREIRRMVLFLIFALCFIFCVPSPAQAAGKSISVKVEVPGMEPVTLEMQKTDYVGNVKYKLQNQVDVDLNKMDLIYDGKILSEVKRFSSNIVPDGATITMQASSRFQYDEVKGVDGITFSIARPKEENLTKVYAKDYGMSPENQDNSAAFVECLTHCTADAYLVIEQGTYHFRDMQHDIDLNNFENVIIDGNGSTFIFDTSKCMKVYGGNGVEIRNLKVDWDWDKIPVGSLVQIEKKHSNTVFDIRFIGVDEVDENIPIGTFMYLDPKDLVVGSYGTYKAYTPGSVANCLQKVEKVGNNILRITHNGDMKHFNEGEYYLLRHFEYSGRVFNTTNYAKNITYDNVSIYGFTGMGWVFSYKTNHFQIIHSYLGLNPNGPKERRISTAADAIHIVNTGGYFRISNNELGFTGDDIINIHDDVMDIMAIDDDRTTIRGWVTSGFVEAGDVLGFRNSQMGEFTDYEAKVTSFVSDPDKTYERIITLAEPLPDNITTDCYAYGKSHASSYYVISDNYIHEARARAALLNDDYGLFENNYVYRMISGAIQVCSDVNPGRWLEGDGASHVEARNNLFEECNFGSRESLVDIRVKVNKQPGTEQVLRDIRVENNVFLNCILHADKDQHVVKANNVDNLSVTGNVLVNVGEIVVDDVVGTRIVKDNSIHTEHQFVKGICSSCYQIWEKEMDGITYRAISKVVNARPAVVPVSGDAEGAIALTVVRAEGVAGKDVVLPGTITDEVTGQKYILTKIDKNAFVGSNATSITIPESVTDIGENAFGEVENIIYAHTHKLKDTITKATLSENGKIITKCEECGAVIKTKTIYRPKTFTLSATKYTYDGKTKKPSVTVKNSKGNDIDNTNFSIQYSEGRKNVGKYTVTISFKGNYSGTKDLSFKIYPPTTTISSLTAKSKAMEVKWEKRAKQVTGYQIQYSASKDFQSGNKSVRVTSYKTVSKTVKNLEPKQKYYFRIRTYTTVAGKKYYSDWSKVIAGSASR